MTKNKGPLWWRILSRLVEILACFDILIGYIPLVVLEFSADKLFVPPRFLTRSERRFYLQALVGPHVYATVTFLLVTLLNIHWYLLLLLMIFYCFCIGGIQLRGNVFYSILKLEKSQVSRDFEKRITITKFIFATWAFLVMGIILILPSS